VPAVDRVPMFAQMYALAGSDFVPGQKGLSNARAMKLFLERQGDATPRDIMRTHGKRGGSLEVGLHKFFRGGVQASATSEDPSLIYRDQRADFSVNYWRHSVWHKENAYVSPLNHGFSLGAHAQIVYTEDLLGSGANSIQDAQKRVRLL